MRIQGTMQGMQYNQRIINNVIKQSVTEDKLQQKTQKKESTQAQRDLEELKKRMDDIQRSNKTAGIHTKITVGAKLTRAEIKYIKNKHPEIYREYKEVEQEKETYRKRLERCKTKEEVEKLKVAKMGQFMSSAKRISSNANIPKEKKIKLLKKLLMKSNNVEAAHTDFVKSVEYAKLPEKKEEKNKIKNRKITKKKIKLDHLDARRRDIAEIELKKAISLSINEE